jgi:hypothetical protein
LAGDLHGGYSVSSVTTLDDLLDTEPDGWTHLYFQIVCEMPDGTAFAGETSYGGAGFFAFRTPGGFEWVIHLHNMNNPVSLTRDGNTIVGRVDSPYPYGSVFRIPVDDPERFTVSTNKEEAQQDASSKGG